MWHTTLGPFGDIVLSSRIRLARNVSGIPFGEKLTKENQKDIQNRCKAALSELKFIDLSKMNEVDRTSLSERHLISPKLSNNASNGSILINNDCSICVMIGEEDHIRIQSILPGLDLFNAFDKANEIDDLLEDKIDVAYDKDFGYLTACPTNTGTALRASVMMHLPSLTKSGSIGTIIHSLSKLGLCIRGIYGEGSESLGDIYQISNQITLGVNEEETIKKLEKIIKDLISKEMDLSKSLYSQNKFELEDKIMRSKGILENARIMTSSEAIKLIFEVRWGVNLGIIKDITHEKLLDAFYSSLPATLTKNHNLTSLKERDLKRCEVINRILSS